MRLPLFALLCLPISAVLVLAQGNTRHPNIVVILADDQGWGDLSLHGNGNLNTRNLDRLAREGVRFTNFYVQPVCSPTRAEFLTGRYYPRGNVYDTGEGGERLDPGALIISEVFKAAGYSTAVFGKWHNGTQAPYHPCTRGFDEFYGFTGGHWGSYFDPMLDHNGTLVTGRGYIADDLTNHTIAYIEKQSLTATPFFVYLALPIPHSPMQTTDEDWARFKDRELAFQYTGKEKENLDETRAALAMVENIDSNVGRLLSRLNELHLEDDTIILYFSDNGPNSWRWNGGMRGRKTSTDEGGVRSPFFIRWPQKLTAGREIETIAADIDLLPTLTELAGVALKPRQAIDGVSHAPELLGRGREPRDRILFSYWSGKISARSQRYRLDSGGRLYDIENDRGQTEDVANLHPEITASLGKAIAEWRADVLAPGAIDRQRPYTVGYPGLAVTQLPARDAFWVGGIERSNFWTSCSYLRNWANAEDRIYWETEVGIKGRYRAVIYYTCPEPALGCTVTVQSGKAKASARISVAVDSPAYGMEHDRVPRKESYVKDFGTLELGVIDLQAGRQRISLSALGIPSGQTIEFRLLLLERL